MWKQVSSPKIFKPSKDLDIVFRKTGTFVLNGNKIGISKKEIKL